MVQDRERRQAELLLRNPEFDATCDEALSELDEGGRAELAQQADRILTQQDWGTIPL